MSTELIVGKMDNTINDSITGYITTTDYNARMLQIVIDDTTYTLLTHLDTTKDKNIQSFKFYVPLKYEDNKLHNVELYDQASNTLLDTKQYMFHYLEDDPNAYKVLKEYENEYKNNTYRSIKQRLESIFYPVSIILNKNKFGSFKKALNAIKGYRSIKKQSLLDVGYYLNHNKDLLKSGDDVILHYFYEGFDKGLKPSRYFDGDRYLKLNPDVKAQKFNPLIHYALYGKQEKRYKSVEIDLSKLPESIQNDILLITDSGLFNETYYLDKYEDVLNSKIHPIEHYVRFGYKERRNPSSSFNTDYYIKTYDDCNINNINPLVHYIKKGSSENRNTTGVNGHIQLNSDGDIIEGWYSQDNSDENFEGTITIDKQTFKLDSVMIDEDSSHENTSEQYYRFELIIPENFLNGRSHFVKFMDSEGIIIDSIVNFFHNIEEENQNKPKRTLTKDEMQELDSKIRDIDTSTIPEFRNDAPLVSIIVVNRNGLNHLKRLFSSVNAISEYYPNFEFVVVDNDSSDGSLEYINSITDIDVNVIQNEVNESFSHANNQALDVAKGEYLLFLNNDIEPLDGFLNFMMQTMLDQDNAAAVGAHLFYPDCSSSKLNHEKSYTTQHAGIEFKESEGYICPFNRENGFEIQNNSGNEIQKMAAVTAACMLVDKEAFLSVDCFDEGYVYGYEDVDLCLKFISDNYDIFYDSRACLYHYEFGTQESDSNRCVRDRRLNNRKIFINKWNSWLRQKLLLDKMECNKLFNSQTLTVAFVVTQSGEGVTAGDYFTALSLASKLESFGWNIRYLAQKPGVGENNWYFVDDDVDVLISLLDKYDLRKVRCNNGLLIKVAWLRNWFERWVEMPYFRMFDFVLASSNMACDYVYEKTGINSYLYPLATDNEMFNEDVSLSDNFTCDYCFTGSYWNAEREIVNCLDPSTMDYTFNLYGANWDQIEGLSDFHKGFVSYDDMPTVYASTRVVLDDANHVTRGFASVNSRVFDALASGKLVFTNGSLGNNEVFDGLLPEYHSKEQLRGILGYYLENPTDYEKLVKQLQKIVLENHTYTHRANTLKSLLEEYIKKDKIIIKMPVPSWDEIYQWGDFYLAEGLMKAFIKEGYGVRLQVLSEWDTDEDSLADNVLVLRGLSKYEPKVQHLNMMWNISHPDIVSIDEYSDYNHIFIASSKWSKCISDKVEVPVECMWQCTDTNRFYYDYDEKYSHELLFVGNSRKVHRKILEDLLPTEHDLAVYGDGWENLIDKKYVKETYIRNDELRKAYSSCKILLNDHWEDMRNKGFVSNRIFDAVACGSCIISDDIEGLNEIFKDRIITYTDSEELTDLVEITLKTNKKYDTNLIKGHSYSDRVKQIINVIKKE